MNNPSFKRWSLFLVPCIALAGCASTKPTAYSGLASSPQLQANAQDKSGRVPFSYSQPVDWHRYSRIVMAPVVVYGGPDNQFDDISDVDKDELANYMQAQFSEKLSQRFHMTSTPSPETLRVKLTLTGAKTTTPVLSTFTHFDLAGNSYNLIQTARGKEGAMTGSVSYAVEIYDASSNHLLYAYVTKQYPNPMNMAASFGSLGASKTGIRKGAEELVASLN